jgi:AraC-like DNA-binding protein
MPPKEIVHVRSCSATDAPPGWCLRWVARAHCQAGMSFSRDNHLHTSFAYIESGYGTVTIGGTEERLGPGDAFILPEGGSHRLSYDEGDPWRQLFVGVSGPLPEQLLRAYGIESKFAFRNAAIAQPIRNLLQFNGDDRELQLRTGQALTDMVATLHASVNVVPNWPKMIIKAKSFIDANLENIVRLADVAGHVGCSEAHLSRHFRQCVGSPPGEYLLSRRMDLAKALLDTTDDPVKAIAERLCYRDTFAFSHAFKSALGVSPTAWRSAHSTLQASD